STVQGMGNAMGPRDVPGPDAGRQAEFRAIRDGNGFPLGLKGNDADDWAKNLLLCNSHLRGDIGEDGRQKIIARGEGRAFGTHAAVSEMRTLLDADPHVFLHALALPARDQGAHLRRLELRVAQPNLPRAADELAYHLVVNRAMDKQTGALDAGLPAGD